MFLKRKSEKVDRIRDVPLFAGFSDRQLDRLASEVDEVDIKEGVTIARQGELGHEFILILDGNARVEREGTVLTRLGPGDYFGEMSLIDGKPRTADVTAETPVAALVMHLTAFNSVLDEIPELRKRILVTLSERLRAADARLADCN